jgi:hypothetical protein
MKEPQRAAPVAAPVKMSQNRFDNYDCYMVHLVS